MLHYFSVSSAIFTNWIPKKIPLWKCTESPIEILQIRYVLADFELSYILLNKNSLKLLNIIFENSSPKGSFGTNKKKKLNFCFCRRILENCWQPLLIPYNEDIFNSLSISPAIHFYQLSVSFPFLWIWKMRIRSFLIAENQQWLPEIPQMIFGIGKGGTKLLLM